MKRMKNYAIIGEFSEGALKKHGKNEGGVKREKRLAAALGLAVMLGLLGGCGDNDTAEPSGEQTAQESETADEDSEAQKDESGEKVADSGAAPEANDGTDEPKSQEEGGTDEGTAQESEWVREEQISAKEPEEGSAENGAGETGEPEERQSLRASEGTEHLGGKVQEAHTDGMTLAQTTLQDDDGMVTLLTEEEAKKIPVKFTEETKVEHWTIQGGGAGIDRKDASVSDLTKGQGVELEGYYEGDTFVATRVLIEVYV